MFESEVYVGDWDEVSRLYASALSGHRVEIVVLDKAGRQERPRQIYRGMFPGLLAVTEDDFRAAEWHGPADDEL